MYWKKEHGYLLRLLAFCAWFPLCLSQGALQLHLTEYRMLVRDHYLLSNLCQPINSSSLITNNRTRIKQIRTSKINLKNSTIKFYIKNPVNYDRVFCLL